MKYFLLPLLTALALPTAVNADLMVSKNRYLASLPVAPFTDPLYVEIPEGFPFNTVSPQLFKRADWFKMPGKPLDYFRFAHYVGKTRRSGNIVSLVMMNRSIFKNTPEKSDYIPDYSFSVQRYDCANDRSNIEAIAKTSPDLEGYVGFTWAKPYEKAKVSIEGYPYWAVKIQDDPGSPEDWEQVRIGSYGASHLDYVCSNY